MAAVLLCTMVVLVGGCRKVHLLHQVGHYRAKAGYDRKMAGCTTVTQHHSYPMVGQKPGV